MARGVISSEISAKAKEIIGRDITQDELRLMPYLQYLAVNKMAIDRQKVSYEEICILVRLVDDGHIETAPYLWVGYQYWLLMSECIYMAYVQD